RLLGTSTVGGSACGVGDGMPAGRSLPVYSSADSSSLILNIAPVGLSRETMRIGRLPNLDHDAYQELRDTYWGSHAFRFDARTQEILNVAIESHVTPLGSVEDVRIDKHLLLAARTIQHAILVWIAPKRPVLRANKQLVF